MEKSMRFYLIDTLSAEPPWAIAEKRAYEIFGMIT